MAPIKGVTPWNKDKTNVYSAEALRKMSIAKLGKILPNRCPKGCRRAPQSEFKKGRTPWNKGMPNLSWAKEANPAWKGGITSENEKLRKSTQYYDWRRHVFSRDNFTCQACGEHGKRLEADHVLPFSQYLDLRFEILNGRTLCRDCHKLTPTYGEKAKTFDI